MRRKNLHLKLGYLNTAIFIVQLVAIPPLGVAELWALDNDLAQLDALAGLDILSDDIDASSQAKDQTGVVPVEDEVSTGQEDLARSRYGSRVAGHDRSAVSRSSRINKRGPENCGGKARRVGTTIENGLKKRLCSFKSR